MYADIPQGFSVLPDFSSLEKANGLPPGALDAVWKQESNRGKSLVGPQTKYGTAKGHFQFIDSTAKEYGLDDPNDLNQSAEAAARYLGYLTKKYGGDFNKALAAYNWGPGNVDKKGLEKAPSETRNYVANISRSIEGNNALQLPNQYSDVPEGFQVYSDVPEGFSVEEPTQNRESPEQEKIRLLSESSFGDLGRSGRSLLKGVTTLLDLPGMAYNALATTAENLPFNGDITYPKAGSISKLATETVDKLTNNAFVPKTDEQKFYSDVNEFAGSTLAGNPGTSLAKMVVSTALGGVGYAAGNQVDDSGILGTLGGIAGAVIGNDPKGAVKSLKDAFEVPQKTALKIVSKLKQSPVEKANDIVIQALKEDGLDPLAIAQRLENSKKTGLPVTALDVAEKNIGGVTVGGRNVQGLADAAASRPGRGAAKAGEVAARGQAQKIRVGSSLDKALSSKNIYDVSDEAFERISTEAPPAYEAAFSSKPVISDRVNEFVNTPEMQSGISRGLKIQRLESVAEGKPFDPKDYGITGFNEAGDPIISGVPNMRLLDAGKKGLDAMIAENTNDFGKLNEMGRALTKFKKSYVSELDSINPAYAEARKIYGDQASRLNALEQGRNFMRMDKEEISRFISDTSIPKAEKAAFKVGVRRAIQDKVDSMGANTNVINQVWKENIQGRLEPLFGSKKQFNEFAKKMMLEKRMSQVNQRLQIGSQTAPRQEYGKLIEEGADIKPGKIVGALTSPVRAGVEGAVDIVAGKLQKKIRGLNSETAAEIVDILLTNDPDKFRKIDAIAKANKLNPKLVSNAAKEVKWGTGKQAAVSGILLNKDE